MKHYADSEYLHTRMYAMKGRLFRLKDYSSLLREYEFISDRTANPEHSMISEKETLFKDQIRDVIRLAEATDYHSPLFVAFLRHFEILNLKLLVAKAYGRESLEQWYDIDCFALLDRSLLDENISPGTIERMLKNTYLDGLFEGRENYDRLKMHLEGLTIQQMLRCADSLNNDDGACLREILFTRAAVLMTVWKWRLTLNYGWSDAKINQYRQPLLDLMGEPPAPCMQIVEQVLNRGMEDLKKQTGAMPGAGDIEYHLETFYHRWLQHVFYRDFHSICCVASYLLLLTRQIQNMFSIVEGLRFRMSREAILGRIISDP